MRMKRAGARQPQKIDKAQTVVLVIAAIAAIVGLTLLMLMLFAAPMLVRWGLVGQLWFVLLLALGMCAAVVAFGVFRSWAYYAGEVFSGKLELGGPVVVMLVVVFVGFLLAPSPTAPFDVTVFLKGKADNPGQLLTIGGQLAIDIGADRRVEAIGQKAEVRFLGIPSNMRGQRANVMLLNSDRFELAGPSPTVKLDTEAQYLLVRVKTLTLTGLVSDAEGRPVSGARVSMAEVSGQTDVDGRFKLDVSADIPDGERYIVITALGFSPYRAAAVPGGSLQVRLER